MSIVDKDIEVFHGEFAFLSNFFQVEVLWHEGRSWQTVEHAFQAMKTSNIVDQERIREAATPGRAKRLGRKITMRPDWNTVRDEVMLDLLRKKFANPSLGDHLVGTSPRNLIEGNVWGDRYWGVCEGTGLNRLGNLLMQVREEVAAGQK